jgi:hypothetical protein
MELTTSLRRPNKLRERRTEAHPGGSVGLGTQNNKLVNAGEDASVGPDIGDFPSCASTESPVAFLPDSEGVNRA